MKALYDEGFPTPVPIDVNRHVVLMSKVLKYVPTHMPKTVHFYICMHLD
jgi:RIO-like serine/threonine protein kinase